MENKSHNNLTSTIMEVVIAAILIIFILITLNYFQIIPLSQTFSFLSFLPSQNNLSITNRSGSSLNSAFGGVFSRTIIRPVNLKKFINTNSNFLYNPIASSSVLPKGSLRVDMEIADLGEKGASQGSSLNLSNKLKYQDPNYRGLRVFYSPQNNYWFLEAKIKSKSQFFPLKKGELNGVNFIRVGYIIGPQGRTLTLFIPNQNSRTVQLIDSLYSTEKSLSMTAWVAPKSELDVYGLYYQY